MRCSSFEQNLLTELREVVAEQTIDGRTVVVEITLVGTWVVDGDSPPSYSATFRVGVADGPVGPCVLVDEPGS